MDNEGDAALTQDDIKVVLVVLGLVLFVVILLLLTEA